MSPLQKLRGKHVELTFTSMVNLFSDTLENKWKFRYDDVWGGVFLRATRGNLDYGVDFGFPYYNDHHYHLGYFIYAIAYYVEKHNDWGRRKFNFSLRFVWCGKIIELKVARLFIYTIAYYVELHNDWG